MSAKASSGFLGFSSLGPPQAEQARLPGLLVNVQAAQFQEEVPVGVLGALEPQAEQAKLPPLLFSVQAGHSQDGGLGTVLEGVAHPRSEPFLAAIVSLLV